VNLHKSQSPEPVEDKKDLTAQVLHWARDRTEAFEESSAVTELKPAQEPKPKASPRVIVIALHEGTDNCGEAHLFEELEAARRFVETIVEGGLDQQRLTVFNCTQLNVHLTYRPVVYFKASGEQEEPAV
jgi:hypothetical protein